jgi:murein DD-endopeptidase MepM/ murein hydrolase activator NlpD
MKPPSPFLVASRARRLAAVTLCAAMAGLVAGTLAGSLAPAAAAERPAAAQLDAPGTALKTAERLSLKPRPAPVGMLMLPVDPGKDCYVLDNFGDARGTRLHEGLDITGNAGRAVFAVAAGKLTKRYTNTGSAGWGWTLFDATTKTTYKYYHLTEDPNGLSEGDTVAVGQTIGFVGSSGTDGPTNNHLHFEVRPGNVAVDPLPLLHIDGACRVSPPIR